MEKYRVKCVTLIATDTPDYGKELKVTVTGVNVENDKDVAIFTDDIDEVIASFMCTTYFKKYWEDDAAFFTGEYVEVELPNKEKATVFCRCTIDEDGNKIYAKGDHPTWKMHKLWVQMQQEASQTQPTTTGR